MFAAVAVAALLLAIAGVLVAVAQSGSDAANSELDKIAARPSDDSIVALVNGEPITRRAVDVTAAFALLGDVSDASGRPVDPNDQDAILQQLIDNALLAQDAAKAGAKVSEDEVTLAIHSGIIDPLNDPNTPKDLVDVVEKMLKAMGTDSANVVNDINARNSYRRFLLIQRGAALQGGTLDERLANAHKDASIQVFEDVLKAPR